MSTPVQAAPSKDVSAADKAHATELFNKGADAYLKGDFAQSIKLLEEAHDLDPQPVLLYNEARAHEGMGHTDDAIRLYEQYLTEEPTSKDRGAIEQRLTTLKKQRDDKAQAEKDRVTAQRERDQRAADDAAQNKPRKRSPFPYVVAGVGGAGIVTGVVFGMLAKGKEDDGNAAKVQKDAIDARDTGKTFATVANISLIAGGVLVAAGAVWWALDRSAKRPTATAPGAAVRVGFGPGFIACGGTFQ